MSLIGALWHCKYFQIYCSEYLAMQVQRYFNKISVVVIVGLMWSLSGGLILLSQVLITGQWCGCYDAFIA